jgi:hypothetical protein
MRLLIGVSLCLAMAEVAAAAEEPQWLKDARAKEGTLIAPQPIASEDGWFQTRVLTPSPLTSVRATRRWPARCTRTSWTWDTP